MFALLGSIIGYISNPMGYLCAAALIAVAFSFTQNRTQAFVLMLSYYLAAAYSIPDSYTVFTGQPNLAMGIVLLLIASIFLAGAYILTKNKMLAFAIGLIVSALLPFGWASPINAAGEFFPAWGFIGLFVFASALVLMQDQNQKMFLTSMFILVISFSFQTTSLTEFRNIIAINTHMPAYSSNKNIDWRLQWQAQQVQNFLNKKKQTCDPIGTTYLMPESSIGVIEKWSLDGWLKVAQDNLCEHDKLIVNGEQPLQQPLQQDGLFKFENRTLTLTKNGIAEVYDARASVALVNPAPWHPLLKQVHGKMICYEMFLVWPNIIANIDAPENLVIAQANLWWADSKNTTPIIQLTTAKSWAKLFGNELYFSGNH
jgi:uncharacterized membrane protein